MTVKATDTNSPLYGREGPALARRTQLAQKYVDEGMTKEAAEARAQEEMRANGKGDWRRG